MATAYRSIAYTGLRGGNQNMLSSIRRRRPLAHASAVLSPFRLSLIGSVAGLASSSSSSTASSSSTRSSVNQDEINKFEAYGASWWDEKSKGAAGPLHAFNPVRVKYIVDQCGGNLQGLEVLDVGCGGGLLSEALARLGANVTGIDPGLTNIEVARQHASIDPLTQGIRYEQATAEEFLEVVGQHVSIDPLTQGIRYEEATAEEFLAAGERFDVVVASEVIEHVESPAQFVQSLAGLVEKESGSQGEGHVILSTINRTIKSYLLAIVGAEYVASILPRGTHDWSKFLQPQELAHFCRTANLQIKDVSGLLYNPITDKWRLKPSDIDVNYLLHASVKKEQR